MWELAETPDGVPDMAWSTTEGCAVTITRLPPKEMRRFHALMMSMEAPVIMEPLPLLLESFSPRRQCKQS
jgi:hypothetical protein